ncbi:hypothetical protein BS78_02G233600 [Paspalum vaginatum]|nr:hypothetical protein BS78_02G233600 [Paspalum vaginatum]
MASSPPSWLILHKATRVSAHQGEGFSVTSASPPLISRLNVSAAQLQAAGNPPRVLAADLSAGLFLLRGPGNSRDYTVLAAANPNCTYRVPAPACSGRRLASTVGVIGGPGGIFMVVGFESRIGRPKALLHCYWQGAANWASKQVDNPDPGRAWEPFDDVIAHAGRIWWVCTGADKGASGLLSCDPFAGADDTEMVFSTSPELRKFCTRSHCSPVRHVARRCVQVAGGKLRWVQIVCHHVEHDEPSRGRGGPPTVLMLTLDHPTAEWRRSDDHHRMSFGDIWDKDIYSTQAPALALVDPTDPSVVYFSHGGDLVGVDMRAKEMLWRLRHEIPDSDDVASSSLLAWVLPPALRQPPAPISDAEDKILIKSKIEVGIRKQ